LVVGGTQASSDKGVNIAPFQRKVKSMTKHKVHYSPGNCGWWSHCPRTYGRWSTTARLAEVTCRICLRAVAKLGLQPREAFPEVPTFAVRASGRFRYGCGELGCYLSFRCPVCGQENHHSGMYGQPGEGDGHRGSHCPCWKKGYYIQEIQPAQRVGEILESGRS
jgi:hypothetical protein